VIAAQVENVEEGLSNWWKLRQKLGSGVCAGDAENGKVALIAGVTRPDG